jgi:hypothetical protein
MTKPEGTQETGNNPWDETLGPFFAESAIIRAGLSVEDLISLTTSDGVVVYPHAQFDELPNGQLRKREKVLVLWNTLIKPVIDRGVIDEWSATSFLLSGTPEHPSQADLISEPNADPSLLETLTFEINHAFPEGNR